MSLTLRVVTVVDVLDEDGRPLFQATGMHVDSPWPVVDDEAPAANPLPRGPAADVFHAIVQSGDTARLAVKRDEAELVAVLDGRDT